MNQTDALLELADEMDRRAEDLQSAARRLRESARLLGQPELPVVAGPVAATAGERLRELRRRAMLGQEAMAERLGLSCGHLAKLERGQTPVSSHVVASVARGFGLLAADFVSGGGVCPPVANGTNGTQQVAGGAA